ncbi:hypothetical protein PHYBOEH_010177 [Phytophthora boehmeriae]|uniref:Macro domain-containing protein n=1 Tax=Phytophthora boehmeriae TaxID=109152 RepID=A0A8T1VRP7_9STRA|nr:hypothetical protein PHYBOEH_010177 [Phytophthora boehmeriae]
MATRSDGKLQAPPAQDAASTAKRQRLGVSPQPPAAIRSVLDVESLLQGLLSLLDMASLASFLEILALDESWRGILSHESLWHELLNSHFKGNLPTSEEFNDSEEEEEEGEEEEEEEENEVLELEDAEIEEIEELFSEEEDEEVSEVENEAQETSTSGATSPGSSSLTSTVDSPETVITWPPGLPSQNVLSLACTDLKHWLRSAEQMLRFDANVQIIRGDIGQIKNVGDLNVDGLAFPTAAFLRNPHVGAAAVIFRRAGHRLTEHVNKIDVRLDVGQVHATPGFDAGVDKLIHVVGPSGLNTNCLKELQRTYRSVLRCIQHEKLNCVAMTSISTGNMGLPVDSASWSALCAMQRFMRSTDWTATVAMVCFEPEVYAAFVKSKTKLLSEFNSDSVRADPPPLRLR